ncbi:MAG: hypothetical protein RIQ60_3827 [Pseudomonadota bacterium]|jgi:two-component system response regulator AtoC
MPDLNVLVVDDVPAVRLVRAAQAAGHAAGAGQHEFRFRSPAMLATERLVTRVAPTDSTVLLSGESGTGKGVAARRIHALSARRDGPFVAVNCAAMPDTLIESELFGHTKGAFTGADRPRKGLFVQADQGSIFLDEIGELPLALQTKLLHVLEAKEVRALGSEQARPVDVRIIAATNRDLPAMVAEGRFREDLFFRLSVFEIALPALRERRADLPGLLRHLLAQRAATVAGECPLTLVPEAEEMLVSYPWPGNVRQLENVLHRAAILADGGCIRPADLPPEVTRRSLPANSGSISGSISGNGGGGDGLAQAGHGGAEVGLSLRERVRRFEVHLILRAIEDADGDRRLAAQRLGIGLSSLYRKLEEFNGDAAAA